MEKAQAPIFDKWDFPQTNEDYNISRAVRTERLRIAEELYQEAKACATERSKTGDHGLWLILSEKEFTLKKFAHSITMLALYGGEL